jgi:hypothetical protein
VSNQELTLANHTFDLMTVSFAKMLPALKNILVRAEADCGARKIDPQVLLRARLAPDMFDFTRQVQITTDQVKGGMARLAGAEVPSWPDDETSFADLVARVDNALAFMAGFSADQYEGAETRKIELKFPNASFEFVGRDYLVGFVMPNFYFHMTTAYAILRHNGVAIGKRDFLGG